MLYQPEMQFLVRWNKYEPKTEYTGISQARRLYVLCRCCRIKVVEQCWEMCGGEYMDIPDGEYHFTVLSDSSVEIVSVWQMPEEYS